MKAISESEFIAVVQDEHCQANVSERGDAISPIYLRHYVLAQEMLSGKTYPTWRTNREATQLIGAYEVSREEAFPISYIDLSQKPHLFDAIHFDVAGDYLATKRIISFQCSSCRVRVVKDGNHRLLQCALHKLNPQLEVYEVVSQNWSACRVDMKNFCECISNQPLHQTLGSGAPRRP